MQTLDLEQLRPRMDVLCREHDVVLAYLFGSQVSGYTHDESDIDVAALFDPALTVEQRGQARLRLDRALCRLLSSDRVDLSVLNEAPPLLAYEVVRTGLLIHCRDESLRVMFQVDTIRRYEDTAPLRKVLRDAMYHRLSTGRFGHRPVRRKEQAHAPTG